MRVSPAHAWLLLSLCVFAGCEQEQSPPLVTKIPAAEAMGAPGQSKPVRIDVDGLNQTEILRGARQAAEMIENDWHRARLSTDIALFEAKAGDRAAAAESFRAAIDFAMSCGEYDLPSQSLLNWIAVRQAEAGDFKGAIETNALDSPSVYTARLHAYIAFCQARLGRLDEADRTLVSVRDARWQSFALAQIGIFQWNRGDRDGAIAMFERASEAIDEITDCLEKTKALADLAEAYVALGDRDSAKTAIDKALQNASNDSGTVWTAEHLKEVARAQAACGDVKGVLRTDEALKRDKFRKRLEWVTSTVKRGDFESVFDVWKRVGLFEYRTTIFDDIVTAYSHSGDFETAKAMAGTMRGGAGSYRCRTLSEIARRQIAVGKLADAVETCSAIESVGVRARVQSKIAAVQMEAGNVEQASTLFDQLHEMCTNPAVAKLSVFPAELREISANEAEAGRALASWIWATQLEDALARTYALLGILDGIHGRLPSAIQIMDSPWP